MVDIDALVPKDHLLRKIEKVMDYDWLYERLDPYYNHETGRPGEDPVVIIKMALLEHLYGIPSLRQTHQRINDTISYRWFLGYSLLDKIPHFATVSYAFCQRFPAELTEEIFEHILNKLINNRMVDPRAIFIDGTHIKASANKKKYQKEQVKKAAKIYDEQLRQEVNAERERLGKKPIKEDDDDERHGGGTVEKAVSTTDPDAGLFVKGEHERQMAYEAHTACDKNGVVLATEVTPGNVHDSVAWDAVYDKATERFKDAVYVVMDSAYKTPWIAKKTIDDHRVPIVPYSRRHYKEGCLRPWDYKYDSIKDQFVCPKGQILRHTTTTKEGKRIYRSTPKNCLNCPLRAKCGANAKGQKVLQTHIWQYYLDALELLRKTDYGKDLYAQRKETIERVFADAKEKHAMRYTHRRSLIRVTSWVRLKYAAMNLKKLAKWSWNRLHFCAFLSIFFPVYAKIPCFA